MPPNESADLKHQRALASHQQKLKLLVACGLSRSGASSRRLVVGLGHSVFGKEVNCGEQLCEVVAEALVFFDLVDE